MRLSVLDQALLAEAARLRALPFLAQAAPGRTGGEATPGGAVGELFPHADPSREEGSGRFLAGGDQAGSFETFVTTGGVRLTRVARWVRCEATGWRPADAASVQGWDAAAAAPLPGEALLVRLEASAAVAAAASADDPGRRDASPAPGGATRTLTVVLSVDANPRAVGPVTAPTGAR